MKPPLNLTEAAKYLKVSRSWLYQNKDKIPHHRLPGTQQIRFFVEELEDWIRGNHHPVHGTMENQKGEALVLSGPRVYHRKSRPTR